MEVPGCPVCAFSALKESETNFRCVKCSATFSRPFIRKIRRQQFSSMIEENFGTVQEERVTVIPLNAVASVAESVAEADGPQHLEDCLEFSSIEEKPHIGHTAEEIHTLIMKPESKITVYRPDHLPAKGPHRRR